jgi:hypothetical protein
LTLCSRTFGGIRTYYCSTFEEALRRPRKPEKNQDVDMVENLPNGRKGLALYREGKVNEEYAA